MDALGQFDGFLLLSEMYYQGLWIAEGCDITPPTHTHIQAAWAVSYKSDGHSIN